MLCCCSVLSWLKGMEDASSHQHDQANLRMSAPSVHFLANNLIEEIRDKGIDAETATIYDLEDLRSKDCGFIRSKGDNVICPQDGRLGAAYVDCIHGDDFVGQANVMLSYTWGYRIMDIVTTLVAQCQKEARDPKRTYVWICCLCNNQHRIADEEKVAFEDFRKIFYGTVAGVGTVWSMMFPWDNPTYLTRVWCVFEMYVANTEEGVISKIIIPESEKNKMIEDLGNIDTLFNALSNTKIENAKASRPDDEKNILALIEDEIGYKEFNVVVNVLLREWISSVLLSVVVDEDEDTRSFHDTDDAADYTTKLSNIANALSQLSFPEDALKVHKKCLAIREKSLGKEHPSTATV